MNMRRNQILLQVAAILSLVLLQLYQKDTILTEIQSQQSLIL